MTDYRQLTRDLSGPTRELRAAIPEVWAGYAALHKAALADGAVPSVTKELLALAIAVVRQCDGCIAAHARGAARLGATSEELAEVLGVVALMDGGPATVYGPRAWEAFHQFRQSLTEPAAGPAR